jgi:hypothetical protein
MTDCIKLGEESPPTRSPPCQEIWDYKEFTRSVEARVKPERLRMVDSADIICIGAKKRPGTAPADKEGARRTNVRAKFPILK